MPCTRFETKYLLACFSPATERFIVAKGSSGAWPLEAALGVNEYLWMKKWPLVGYTRGKGTPRSFERRMRKWLEWQDMSSRSLQRMAKNRVKNRFLVPHPRPCFCKVYANGRPAREFGPEE